ncbi:MAG: hypothetical protein ACRDS9_12525 [Pseudonocardiaceae bacterium]
MTRAGSIPTNEDLTHKLRLIDEKLGEADWRGQALLEWVTDLPDRWEGAGWSTSGLTSAIHHLPEAFAEAGLDEHFSDRIKETRSRVGKLQEAAATTTQVVPTGVLVAMLKSTALAAAHDVVYAENRTPGRRWWAEGSYGEILIWLWREGSRRWSGQLVYDYVLEVWRLTGVEGEPALSKLLYGIGAVLQGDAMQQYLDLIDHFQRRSAAA